MFGEKDENPKFSAELCFPAIMLPGTFLGCNSWKIDEIQFFF